MSKKNQLMYFFKEIEKGHISKDFKDLVKSTLKTSHSEHTNNLSGNTESFDCVYGANIITTSNTYRPHFLSSSQMLIRGLFLNKNNNPRTIDVILEIGCGTGAVLISLINNHYAKYGVGTDINEDAIVCAKNNTKKNLLSDRMQILHSDLFDSFVQKPNSNTVKFNEIVFNIPLWHGEKGGEDIALVDEGGIIFRRFLNEADNYLLENGRIFFTFSNLSNPELLEEFSNKWDFKLILSEYIAETGMFRSVYTARLK